MIRLLLVVVLPLVAPFLIYAFVVWLNRRTAASGPTAAQASAPATPPWLWLLLAGVMCSAIALYLVGPDRGVPPGTKLLPPAVVDGQVVPSRPAEQ